MTDTLTPASTSVNLSAAPGGDLNFDDLFPVEAESVVVAPQVPQGQTPPVAAPQTPAQPEFFIKGQRSVYKTAEDAIRGIDTKDTLIENYRNFLKTKGVNPDTLQDAASQPQTPVTPASPYTYLDNEQKLFDDLASAAERKDPKAWGRTLGQFQQESLARQIAPVLPLLTEVSRQRAIRQISQEVPEFSSFVTSDAYRETLDKLPVLKQAIEGSENNFEMAGQLPQLYQLAYLASQGSRRPEQVVQPVQAAPVLPTQPGRPTTTSPSTMTPPQPGTAPDLRTTAGRKALIQDMESRGIADRQW